MDSQGHRETALTNLRRIAADLPEVNERPSHGAPTFFLRDTRVVAALWDDHHRDGVVGLVAPAPDGVQAEVIAADPDRFYRPAYVGHRGWIGLRLDRDVDWDEVRAVVHDAYRQVAPAKLVARLDDLPDDS